MTVGMTTQLSLLIEMPLLIIGGAIGLLSSKRCIDRYCPL
jgi:glutathione-regulated potassium-efflux system protein KefB